LVGLYLSMVGFVAIEKIFKETEKFLFKDDLDLD
jgi:hypothetical protein